MRYVHILSRQSLFMWWESILGVLPGAMLRSLNIIEIKAHFIVGNENVPRHIVHSKYDI